MTDAATVDLTRVEEAFGLTSESDDLDSRMEKYGVAFAAIDYVLSHSVSPDISVLAGECAEQIEPELELHPPLSKSRRAKIASLVQSCF